MKIVSGKVGKPHVTSQQFRQIIEGTLGQDSGILSSGELLEPELVSNNKLKIRSGMMTHHGNVSSIDLGTYDEVDIVNGSQGMERIDLVVNRYSRNDETKIESNEWVVLMGDPSADSPVAPAFQEGNLQNGDLVDDCPVFEIRLDGINVVEVKKLLKVYETLPQLTSKTERIVVDMTENEFLTNETYNGNPIYAKYVNIPKIETQKLFSLNIPDSFFWIDTGNSYFYPIWESKDTMYPLPYINSNSPADSIWFVLSSSKRCIMFHSGGSDWSGYAAYLLVKYYKRK